MSAEYRNGIKKIDWTVSISRDLWALGLAWPDQIKQL